MYQTFLYDVTISVQHVRYTVKFAQHILKGRLHGSLLISSLPAHPTAFGPQILQRWLQKRPANTKRLKTTDIRHLISLIQWKLVTSKMKGVGTQDRFTFELLEVRLIQILT
ncbi:uncharacterized protein LOC143444198 [Clavelina lepadiformis]|uniref:uncharacterized protein LOC143444198 n=1 Tax=Clavelina lepadiformis TaxID=159417 RepID=UPI0040429519